MNDPGNPTGDESVTSRDAFQREYAALRARIAGVLRPPSPEARVVRASSPHSGHGAHSTQSEPSTIAGPSELPVNEELVRTVWEPVDLAALFAERAQANGLKVTRTNSEGWRSQLAEALAQAGAHRIALSINNAELRGEIAELLQHRTHAFVDSTAADGLDALYDADAGITDVDAAIAESGALVYSSSKSRSRGGFLVPPLHIALVKTTQIAADLLDFTQRDATPLTSASAGVVLIAGPSKTADIEGVLVTGVHGPREAHVLLIETGG